MNLEEARNNIGAEVELDESTKPYTFVHKSGSKLEKKCLINNNGQYKISSIDEYGNAWLDDLGNQIHPRHLKIKPQNYKIHVPTEEESREAQGLFFELGAVLGNGDKHAVLVPNIIGLAVIDGLINFVFNDIVMKDINARHITFQDLRDMVAKKKGIKSIGVDLASGEDKTLQLTGTFTNFEPRKEMTWEDALDAFKEGKEVEGSDGYRWISINKITLESIKKAKSFRIAPQRITLNGEYTKEELLKKIGEME